MLKAPLHKKEAGVEPLESSAFYSSKNLIAQAKWKVNIKNNRPDFILNLI
jgi:hypothetical protein